LATAAPLVVPRLGWLGVLRGFRAAQVWQPCGAVASGSISRYSFAKGLQPLGWPLPNNSSKPTSLRYGNGGTEKRATVASTTRCGLTQVLGLIDPKPMPSSKRPSEPRSPFEALYPNIAAWVQDGWIEIGRDEFSRSFVRALDIGGMVWEGNSRYSSMDDALQALDAGIAKFLREAE
jgi:hypothetical protein